MSVIRRVQRAFRFERPLGLETTLLSGVQIRIDDQSDWTIYNDIFVKSEYDLPIDDTLNHASTQPIRVLDLGANVGFFSLRLLDRARLLGHPDTSIHITMVEGSPRNARILAQRTRIGGLDPETTIIVHGLVGTREGVGHLTQHASSGMSNILSGDMLASPVSFVDIESLADDGIPINLLKCDIEGSELLFLENYPNLLRRCERAVFEFHPLLCDVERCKQLLQDAGLATMKTLRSAEDYEVTYFSR